MRSEQWPSPCGQDDAGPRLQHRHRQHQHDPGYKYSSGSEARHSPSETPACQCMLLSEIIGLCSLHKQHSSTCTHHIHSNQPCPNGPPRSVELLIVVPACACSALQAAAELQRVTRGEDPHLPLENLTSIHWSIHASTAKKAAQQGSETLLWAHAAIGMVWHTSKAQNEGPACALGDHSRASSCMQQSVILRSAFMRLMRRADSSSAHRSRRSCSGCARSTTWGQPVVLQAADKQGSNSATAHLSNS